MPSKFGGVPVEQRQSKFGGVANQGIVEPLQGGANDIPSTVVSDIPDVPIQRGDNAEGLGISAGSDGGLPSGLGDLGNAVLEVMAGINRGALSLADLPAGFANAVLQLSGADARVPTLMGSDIGQAGAGGGFVEDPSARQALGMAGEFLAPGPPIKALSGADDVSRVADDLAAAVPARAPKNKLLEAAEKQGFNREVLEAVQESTTKDKARIKEMISVFKRGRKDAVFRAENRPIDRAGRSLLDRYDHVRDVNKSAGKAIDKAAQSLKGQAVDIDTPITEFAKRMDEFGVKIVDDGKGGFKPVFDDAELIPGDRGPLKEVFRQMSRLSKQGSPDGLDTHKLKRIIDRNVTFGKTKTGMSNDASGALKDFRRGLDGVLDNNFADYRIANEDYAKTIDALDDLRSVVGQKLDLEGASAHKALGTQVRSLTSNNVKRIPLADAIKKLEVVASETGKKFDDSVITQALVADEIDSLFGTTATTSLKGQLAQVGKQVAEQRPTGIGDVAVTAGRAAIKGAARINEKNAIKAIENFVGR